MNILYVVKQLSEGGIDSLLDVYTKHFVSNSNNKVFIICSYPINKEKSLFNKIKDYKVEIIEPSYIQKSFTHKIAFFISLIYFPLRKIKDDKYTFKKALDATQNILYNISFPISIFITLKKIKIDLIHLFGIIIESMFFRYFVLKNNQVIFSEVEDPINRNSNKKIFSLFLKNCSDIIVPSIIIKNKIISICSDVENKISVIPWTINTKNISNYSKSNHSDIIFGASGRLHHLKGFHILIEALSKIKSNNWRLIIAGDGEEKENLLSLAKKNNIADKITFLGWIKDIDTFLSNIDIFIHPSFSEGMPMVIIEALYNSKPVIATDVGSVKEMIDNTCGFIVEKDNSDMLAEKINYFLENKNIIEYMSINAKKTFESKFDKNIILTKIEDIYKKAKDI